MTDNFYIEDLILSIGKETTMERYLPLEAHKEALLEFMRENNVTFKNDMTENMAGKLAGRFGQDVARLFMRFIRIYDFNRQKLREIKKHEGTEKYSDLAALLRLPGVRSLRAELYYESGITLRVLAECTTEEIRRAVREYIERGHRTEIVPQVKEVNCHRAVARMLLRTEDAEKIK